MTDEPATWIVLERDIADSVQIDGQRSTHVAMVLDAATGLVVDTTVGTSRLDVTRRSLKAALTRPAGGLPKIVPDRLVCSADLQDSVTAAASKLSWLAATSINVGVGMWEAEEVYDSMVGHMEGRLQPEAPPSVADWKLLYDVFEQFVAAEPWRRWSDSDYFRVTLSIEDLTVDRYCIVLGGAGIQRGFNVVDDAEALHHAAVSAEIGDDPLVLLEGSLMVHLDPWSELSGVAAVKARRYGWPTDSTSVPRFLTVRDAEPADLSEADARLLILAASAVLAQHSRPLVVAGDRTTLAGEIRFDEGQVGHYEVERPGSP